jgi:hypothetical protein
MIKADYFLNRSTTMTWIYKSIISQISSFNYIRINAFRICFYGASETGYSRSILFSPTRLLLETWTIISPPLFLPYLKVESIYVQTGLPRSLASLGSSDKCYLPGREISSNSLLSAEITNIRGRGNKKDETRQEPAGNLRQVIANAPIRDLYEVQAL